MTELLSFRDGIQFAWDSTSIKLAQECLLKYKLKMIDGWAPATLSVHLRFGAAYATALEHYFKHLANGEDKPSALRRVVVEALTSTWSYDEPAGPWVSDHNTKTRENLIRTIIWYVDHFSEDDLSVVHLANGAPAVEHTFTLPVDNGIIFSGHLDRVVNYADNPMIMDQKTTGTTITSNYFRQFDTDVQMSMYTFAGKIIFSMPIKGVIIDAAQIAVGFSRFERGMTFRTESQLNEWYDHTMHHIEVAQRATREEYFPMNLTSCDKFGGCPYRAACSRSPEVREQFLKADFVKGKRWDPLEVR